MSNRFAEIVILAEDDRSANLLRRYVKRVFGIDNRRIRQEISPSAQGDARKWVLDRHPIEVGALRRMHRRTRVVVHLDADTETVENRSRQLAATLRRDGQHERQASERICHAIPRRHTETWLCVLTGVPADEDDDYTRHHRIADYDRIVQQAALALFQLARPNAPLPALPSLATAIQELRRLEA
jgi:hypothetical protein